MTEKLGAAELRQRAEELARGQAPIAVVSAAISMLRAAEAAAGPDDRDEVGRAATALEATFNVMLARAFPATADGPPGGR